MDGRSAVLLEQMRQGLARIEEANRAAESRLAAYDDFKERCAAIHASATAPDRSVTAVAGAGGAVQQVSFTEQATRLTPTQLSQIVTATIQQAVAAAARQQAALVQEFVGENIRISDRVAKAQQTLPGEPANPPTATRPSTRPTPQDEEDEGFGGVFRKESW
ncbi:YbaB/EbfC family nucleoid-associated protein [Gandjariella thermophila]|uniref:YbaB/EbfC family DNA-binding protein n=1 Tax=Gandjariella thermophila TaxID=1931992 RepID=A0A4D4J6F8_9PSEU|nr:YbaB/EbfC family nucleoid-associated protein [Gandjariella thermophila]GDY30640.1 hypothetical protein GTS_22730 [Gandjariella thermophila]